MTKLDDSTETFIAAMLGGLFIGLIIDLVFLALRAR